MELDKFEKLYIILGKISLAIILFFDLLFCLGQIESTSIIIPALICANASLCLYFIRFYIIEHDKKNE